MKTTTRHAIMALAVIALGITAAKATPIPLNNPSLESGGSAGAIPNDFDGWTESGMTGKYTVAHTGSYGLWNCWGYGWNSLFQQSSYTVAAAGETITASVWAKTDTNLGSGTASFNLTLKVGNDWPAFVQPAYQGGQDWTELTASYVTTAADIGKAVGIYISTDGGPGGGNPGYVYMDDPSLSTTSPQNTWTNASGDFKWNNDDLAAEGRNWTLLSPSPFDSSLQPIWVNGNDADFGATGPGAISLVTFNTVHNLTVNAAGYTFSGLALTFVGATPTLTANADFGLGVNLMGSVGLTIQGPGAVMLNPPSASTYTGGTRVLGGTVILKAGTSGNTASSFALHKIEQLDTGATVKYYNELQLSPLDNLRAPNGQLYNKTDMVMTGGTFDLNGDNNLNQMPSPSGFGIITNTSPNDRAVLKIGALANTTREFSGIIQDGGPVVDSPISGKVGFRTDVDLQSFENSAAEIVLSGPNTYTGSTRRGGGHLKLKGAGTLGVVTDRTPSVGLRINGDDKLPAEVDFNGTSQRVSGMGGNGGKIVNDLAGTTSVLTLGFAPGHLDTAVASWVGSFRDNSGSGGILAVTKIGTNKQTLTGSLHSYSGPTRIKEGTIEFGTTAAPSPNSDHYVTSPGKLALLYSGSKPIKRLFLNGVQVGLGTYDAVSHPDLIEGPGSIQVTDATPVITISHSGSNVTVTWSGGGQLQESTTLADPWTDLPGVTSPYITPIDGPRKFFRLKE
ncbi:MAG: hypothetical protein NTW21_24975 [Verrucomicrobia bacterium]|nr:hypothetical protein [Verrucomicrobiota bacterium]